MHVRIFTLRFDDLLGGFDDAPLQDFIRDKEVIAIRDHFFTREGRSFLALVVTYNLMRPPDPTDNEKRGKKARDAAWRSMLSPEDYPLFNTLREWRSERCKEDGIPPYVICTNKQLAAMVKQMPQSLTGLGEIEGFGKARLEKYGAAILEILSASPQGDPFTEDKRPPEDEETSNGYG